MHVQRDIISDIISALRKNSYEIMQFERSCFDICAKNRERTMLVKFLVNVDSFTESQAHDLAKMASAMDASACLIGLHGRNFSLQDNFVYERFNIPVMNPETFKAGLENFLPAFFSKKGKPVVKMNTEALHRLREGQNLSYRDLGDKVNASKKTMYVIEKSGFASRDIAQRIEEFFDEMLTEAFDFFNWDIPVEKRQDITGDEKEFVERTRSLGLESFILRSAPVNTITISKKKTVFGDWEDNISKEKANVMKSLSEFCSSYNVVLTNREKSTKTVEEIPVISLLDLSNIRTEKQFIRLIIERR